MDYSILKRIPLFHNLDGGDIERIFLALRITETSFKKGEVLAMQDEPCNRLIILIRGSVKAEMTEPSGRVAKVEDIEAPSPLAILFLFGENSRFPVQVTARENVTAIVISRESVLRMLSMNETLLRSYLDISADFASRLSRKLNFMSLRTIRQKAALYIVELARRQHTLDIVLDRPKSAMAEYFGVSRPALERELTRMQADGLITNERKSIVIIDQESLNRLIKF